MTLTVGLLDRNYFNKMANANPARLGQIKAAGDVRALFLKLFSGEVLTVYDANTIMKGKVRARTITSGKSFQFPAIGATKAGYHVPGTEITGDAIQLDEKIVTIDDLLLASTFVAKIDEAIAHFETRAEFSKRMGVALAQVYDRNLLSLAVKAARDTGVGGLGKGAVGQGDAVSYGVGVTPTDQQIVDGFYSAAQALDEKNIPENDRWAIVPPKVWYRLVKNDKLVDKDFSGDNGDYSKAIVRSVANIRIVKSNNLALDHTAVSDANVDYQNKYAVNASTTLAMIMQGESLATVKLLDLQSEMEYDIRRQGTLMVSKMAVGHGVIRPEGLFELKATA